MPQLEFNSEDAESFTDLDTPAGAEIKQLIASIQDSQHLLYKMINLEAWALAETMDHFLPGFWSRFLENRRLSLKQFLQQKRTANSPVAASLSSLATQEVAPPTLNQLSPQAKNTP